MSCNPVNDQDSRDQSNDAGGSRQPSSSTLAAVDGDATSLYQYIIRDKVWGANLDPPESAKNVIKPWNERLSTQECTQSNVDDQLAITVPFTCPVRLKSILIHTGSGDFAPTRCRAFVNRPDGIDFDEADQATSDSHPAADQSRLARAATLGPVGSGKAQADFALLQGQEGVVEYPVSVARFSNTNSVTIILSHSNATTLSRFYFLGFRGTALVLNKEPGERLNIGAANAADAPVDGVREKRGASRGLAGGSSSRQGGSPRFVVNNPQAAERIASLASASQQGSTSPRRSPRSNRQPPPPTDSGSAPSTPTSRKRKGTAHRDNDSSSIPSPSNGRTPVVAGTNARTPRTAPPVRDRHPQASSSEQAASVHAVRRRSSSQPPPNDILMRQLQTFTATPSVRSAAVPHNRTPSRAASSTTPGKRILGTPRRAPTPGHSMLPPQSSTHTPATEKRKKRNDALLASAQRTREKRNAARKSLWGGLGGWAGGREESPMDLLRRLARAPGFVAPPTPSEDSISMPPPSIPNRSALLEDRSRSSLLGRDRARDSLASNSARSSAIGRSSLSSRASRATMLVPGESVPGDLTRDTTNESVDMDESAASLSAEQSHLSDMGIPRRRSGVGIARGGIFAALADRGKAGRISSGSRVSFADQMSPASVRFDDMSSRREDDLERSLARSATMADSFASASNLDLATARAMQRLDDMTRKSFFSDDGRLQVDLDAEDSFTPRKSFVRSMSEPLEGEDSVVAHGDIGGEASFDGVFGDEEDEVSDSLAVEEEAADDDIESLDEEAGRRMQIGDASIISDSRSRTDLFDQQHRSGDISALSGQFGDGAAESFQVDDPYSDDDGQYGLESVRDMEEDVDHDDDDEEEDDGRDAGVRRLDLMDPKDLNALLKRRIVKKRKSRVSPYTGAPVPPLPASVMRDLFSSFLSPAAASSGGSLLSSSGGSGSSGARTSKRAKLDSTVLDELDSACHDFFGQISQNLLTQSKVRTGRKASSKGDLPTTITEADVVAVLKQQGHFTPRHDASSLAHRLLPRELTDQMDLSRWARAGTVQTTLASALAGRTGRKRARTAEADTTAATTSIVADETA